ncbi:hypothetical protein [Deinococcus roseus]|uniref:Uncharacterized protein n=1 Tax=Deinococcus roseus TaxID=392414 RepID=A0ABQ2D6U2_9DEIO|nr:hypothetical protein [Deinococcus roseus]GGJ48120.1 hypothetical protein GCM10008938_37680 [Deinococcus roseus]
MPNRNKFIGVNRLKEALGTDQVLSAYLVEKHFHLPLEYCQLVPGVHIEYCMVSPVANDALETQLVPLMGLKKDFTLRFTSDQLGHMVGAASARLDLNIPPAQWSCSAESLGKGNAPDAVATVDHVRLAVEYDTGAYRPQVIRQKLRKFSREYDRLVWVSSSQTRTLALKRLYRSTLQQLGLDLDVFTTSRWWGPL